MNKTNTFNAENAEKTKRAQRIQGGVSLSNGERRVLLCALCGSAFSALKEV
jgi:hypothetical protein